MLQIDKSLIFDANILIDFYRISKEIFKFLYDLSVIMKVSDVTFLKVEQINESELENLHIEIIESPAKMLFESANRIKSSLAFDDYVSFLHAKENNFILSTNDKTLKTYAQSQNVDSLWGLEIILFIEINNKISKEKAIKLFEKLKKVNNRITDDIEKEFLKILFE